MLVCELWITFLFEFLIYEMNFFFLLFRIKCALGTLHNISILWFAILDDENYLNVNGDEEKCDGGIDYNDDCFSLFQLWIVSTKFDYFWFEKLSVNFKCQFTHGIFIFTWWNFSSNFFAPLLNIWWLSSSCSILNRFQSNYEDSLSYVHLMYISSTNSFNQHCWKPNYFQLTSTKI